MKKFVAAAVLSIVCTPGVIAWGGKKEPAAPVQRFSREDFMLMNLNRGEASTGAQISGALRDTRTMVKGLERALRQLEQVDKQYAKAKGKPDDHYMFQPGERLKQALKTATQLETELEQARDELKEAINQTLVVNQQ